MKGLEGFGLWVTKRVLVQGFTSGFYYMDLYGFYKDEDVVFGVFGLRV